MRRLDSEKRRDINVVSYLSNLSNLKASRAHDRAGARVHCGTANRAEVPSLAVS